MGAEGLIQYIQKVLSLETSNTLMKSCGNLFLLDVVPWPPPARPEGTHNLVSGRHIQVAPAAAAPSLLRGVYHDGMNEAGNPHGQEQRIKAHLITFLQNTNSLEKRVWFSFF